MSPDRESDSPALGKLRDSAHSASQGIEILESSRLWHFVLILLSSGRFGHKQDSFGRSFGHNFGHNVSAMSYRSRPSSDRTTATRR